MGTLPHAFSLFALILLLTSGTGADQSTKTQAIFKGSTGIGAIVDTSSRIGKEEIVAMEVAKEDFYGFGNLTFLLINDSQKDTIHAALEAKDLIDTRQVQAIIGPQTWEEVSLVAEIARETQVPILSFADTAPEWATGRWPSLLQASPDKRAQMKAVAAIVQSWNWHQVIVIYEDTDSSARGVIPHLHDALREVNSQVSQFVAFSPSASSDSMSKELENIKSKQYCRVFVVHLSFKLAVRLFEMAKKMEMMQKDYVWITTDPITSLVHSFNASVISSMKGILGVRSYYPKMGQDFENFKRRFRTSFSRKYPREEKKEPGIYAVQAYDAMRTIALGLNKTGSKRGGKELLENILDADFPGLSGKVKFKNHNVAAAEIFEIVNVIGTGYNEIGYWSNGFGFSEKIHENSRYNSSSMIDLEQVHWPGGPRYTPRGWTTLRSAKLFRIGVPSFSGYEEYVKVESDDRLGTNSSGFANEVFKATTASMPFFLPYEFQYFNGSYNELVEQLHLKNFDAAVGDVEIVASRHQYAEFTYPFTETGLVLIVPVRSSSKAWSFIKPFTTTMWVLISVITVYNGFVVWWIERKHCDELQGSITTQIGIMIWLSFNTLFSLNGPKLHSNLSRMSGVVWLFVALIIIQTYTANLTSMLTVQRLEPTIPTVEELLNSNEMVGYCTDSYTERYLLEVLKFKNQNIQHFQSAESYAQGFEDKKISAAFLGIPSAKKFLAKYCNSFIQIGPTYKIGGFGLAFPRGSPLLASVNEALLSLSEKGALQELEKTWITPQKCTKMPSDDSLGPSGFRELFFITGGTTTIAFVIYVCRTNLLRHKNIWGIISAVLKRWVSPRRHFTRRVANVEISLPEIHLKPVELSTE